MKRKGRGILEAIIGQLEDLLIVEPGRWVQRVEEEKPDDKDSVEKLQLYMGVISADRTARCNAMGTTLVGENRLTPSLTTKGWAFWRSLLVTKEEKKAIEEAFVRWAEAQAIAREVERLPPADTIQQHHANLTVVASIFDGQDSSIRRLCADLKRVLAAAVEE